MPLGIEKVYEITKKVRKELVLNDKVTKWLFNAMKKDKERHFVIRTGYSTYEEISIPLIKELFKTLNEQKFVILSDYPEYDDVPFEVTHASPWNHRWDGDYDENAYDDWEVVTYSIRDLLAQKPWQVYADPIYIEHPELFDFGEEEVVLSKEELLAVYPGF